MDNKGNIIYILINEAMPGYVKIGRTENLNRRMKELYKTSVPLPFEYFYACTVKDGEEVEKWLFGVFEDRRVSNREFFEVPPGQIETALRAKAIRDITPEETYIASEEDRAALNKARTNRDRINFKMIGISVGEELVFSRDESIKTKVVSEREIEFNGEITSLSKSAQRVLGYDYGVNGTLYWMYDGETLDERKRRFESGE